MYDFHTHTFLSDGVLTPIELIRRAHVIGYRVMAITDHVGPGNVEFILKTLKKENGNLTGNLHYWRITAEALQDERDHLSETSKALEYKG